MRTINWARMKIQIKISCSTLLGLIRAMVSARASGRLKVARDVVAKIPTRPLVLIGYLLIDMKQKSEALKCFERTIALMDTDIAQLEKIGVVFSKTPLRFTKN